MASRPSHFARAFLLVGTMAAGFGVGHWIRSGADDGVSLTAEKTERAAPPPRPGRERGEAAAVVKPRGEAAGYRTDDTLEGLMALRDDDLYSRLALWLVDAEAGDFEDCWRALSGRRGMDTRVLDLFFVQWTAADPAAAIQAAEGGDFSYIAWWAWAKNEPKRAFEEALARQPDRVAVVLRSIGQMEPEMAQRLMDQHPELQRANFIDGIIEGLTRSDPEAAMKLLAERRNYYDSRPLEEWMRKDPRAALAWLAENRNGSSGDYYDMNKAFAVLENEHGESLAELAASMRAGALRRKLEEATFRQLMLADPEKALEEARRNPSSLVAVGRFSQIILASLKDDPDRALSVFGELLEREPDPMGKRRIDLPEGGSSWSNNEALGHLLRELAAVEPSRAMEMLVGAGDEILSSPTVSQFADYWAASDVEGFTDWALRVEEPTMRRVAIGQAINQYRIQSDFAGAAPLVLELPADQRKPWLESLASNWRSKDAEAAATWFEEAPLSEEERRSLAPIFNPR